VNVISALSSPWAIQPEKFDEILAVYSSHLRDEATDLDALAAKLGRPVQRREQGYTVTRGVAVIPLHGVIAKKMNMFSQISGGCSTQLVERDIRQALEDPAVKSIVLHADTPGGTVDGTAELAESIYRARGRKPIIALADGLLASAGVWIASAADAIYLASPTTQVGSIGVVTRHVDYSGRDKRAGINVTEIYAGKYKRIASEHRPLSGDGRSYLQGQVDYLYSIFVNAVAQHFGISSDSVLSDMADGRIFVGQQAIEAGLARGFMTLREIVDHAASGRETAAAPRPDPTAALRAAWNENPALRARYAGDFRTYEMAERRRRPTGAR